MKRFLIFACCWILGIGYVAAQDIQISRFERNYTSLIASMNPVYDNAGDACAVIRFFVRDNGFEIEPNLGVVKRMVRSNEIRLWVPKGTKRLTVRYKNLMPLAGYEIPVKIDSKVTYEAELAITDMGKKWKEANKGHNVYIGAGYNVTAISGPSINLGFDFNSHNIELGTVIGLGKTDDLYFYNSSGGTSAAYHYNAVRIQLRYGYEVKVADFFSVEPQAGLAVNIMSGTSPSSVSVTNDKYKSASSLSGLIGLRLIAAVSNRFQLHVTPEYDFGISKNEQCKTISSYDDTFKSWTDGFNLNIGLMYFF